MRKIRRVSNCGSFSLNMNLNTMSPFCCLVWSEKSIFTTSLLHPCERTNWHGNCCCCPEHIPTRKKKKCSYECVNFVFTLFERSCLSPKKSDTKRKKMQPLIYLVYFAPDFIFPPDNLFLSFPSASQYLRGDWSEYILRTLRTHTHTSHTQLLALLRSLYFVIKAKIKLWKKDCGVLYASLTTYDV